MGPNITPARITGRFSKLILKGPAVKARSLPRIRLRDAKSASITMFFVVILPFLNIMRPPHVFCHIEEVFIYLRICGSGMRILHRR
jgi:hypothetical protein